MCACVPGFLAGCFQTALREIDLDLNKRVAFIEYLMFKYKKTLTQLFEEKENTNAALLKKLDEAIDLHEVKVASARVHTCTHDSARCLDSAQLVAW